MKEDAQAVLLEAMMFRLEGASDPTGSAIEAQEARGQKQLVNSQLLPTDCRDWALLEQMGIRQLLDAQSDPMFVRCELPPGWAKRATDHSMWSDLVDDKGRKRAAIFYKAAFYDRSAHMHVCCRFSCGHRPKDGWMAERVSRDKEQIVGYVQDGDAEIWVSEPFGPNEVSYWELHDQARAAAVAWLQEHYPDYANSLAYWD